ncbi:MAG TPA: DUF1761 domain-containing protein [Spirochaetia bacterium]|nr:DUF1761 domain-containing protein [Spirochaetia bacterium]
MQFAQVNWLAVIVGTVFNMVLGFLWYGPILGKPWLAAMEKMGKKRTDMKMSAVSFLLPLIGAFVSCLVLDLIIIAFGTHTWWMGLIAGAVVWIGVGASATLTAGVFEGRPTALWVIGFFYFLVIYVAEGFLFTVWK